MLDVNAVGGVFYPYDFYGSDTKAHAARKMAMEEIFPCKYIYYTGKHRKSELPIHTSDSG